MYKIKFKKKYLSCHLRCFERPSKDPSWLRFRELVTIADKLARLLSLVLAKIWQVKTPELWKSLKFHGNMWTPVCFSAQAGWTESCEDAATLSSELEGQWVERGRERRWKTDAGEMIKAEDGAEGRESGCRREKGECWEE